MNITKGVIPTAKKVVIYGPEGIGKSTFAAQFPGAVFIDTEGSTKEMNVARYDAPTSWEMILAQVNYTISNPSVCKTLIIDTADWAEKMCIQALCDKYGKDGIEGFGYGNGYVYAGEAWGKFLNLLTEVVNKGINVVITAHAQIRKFEQPNEMGAYDRYELKLGKKTASITSPMLKEWADIVLFANYKTFSIAADKDGKKHKAQGGKRVMYTSHHPCWDAKNRYGLPEECDFSYEVIRSIIEGTKAATPQSTYTPPPVQPPKQEPVQAPTPKPVPQPETKPEPKNNPVPQPQPMTEASAKAIDQRIPKALRDLMEMNGVDEWDIQNVVGAKGYFPSDMAVADYPAEFISGVLIGAWAQVYAMIANMKQNQEIPFN